ncbi:MAG: glycosyltransferase [bacterium]|nr:glycosyltransferase [bacterium]
MLKVLHLPYNIGNQSWGLSRAERKIGIKSDHLVFLNNKFGYRFDINLNLQNYWFLKRYYLRFLYLFKSIKEYDIFHFYFKKTFLPFYLDLIIIKLFRKKIFFTFQGSDIRKKSIPFGNKNNQETIKFDYLKTIKFDYLKTIGLLFIKLFANGTFVLNPDLLLISPNSNFSYYSSVNISKIKYSYTSYITGKKFKIIHAPSNRDIKGTKFIISAINKLKKDYPFIMLELIENVPNNEVLRRAQGAHLAIDQLKIGWYGGFAVEMMAQGLPVMCYLNEELLDYLNFKKDIPIIIADPDTCYIEIKKILENYTKLIKISKLSREYVEKYHNPITNAEIIKQEYQNAFK